MKRVLFCSFFWNCLFQYVCFRLMGGDLKTNDALFTAIYASGTLFPIAMLLCWLRMLSLPVLLLVSGLLTVFCVGWVWFASVYIFF